MRHLFYLIIIGLVVACSSPKGRPRAESDSQTPAPEATPARAHFIPMPPPAHLTGEAQRLWLRDHYWDNFDFGDTTLLKAIDSTEMLSAMARYVAHVIGPMDSMAMSTLMQRASQSRSMLCYFAHLGEKLLYDPNSPLRSDELFIPVLEAEASSELLSEYEQAYPRHLLKLVSQNRIGALANDFRYTLADGSSSTLHALKAPYTLLFISNPGCPMCRSVREELIASPMLSSMIERGSMRILMLYPDSDLSEWHNHRHEIPSNWIYAYDQGCILQRDQLYDLKAIPTLYLLDSEKRVLLKDLISIAQIEYTIDQQE